MTSQKFDGGFIAETKARTDIAVLIGRHVALKARGQILWGLCPFHGEKTPSFKVDSKHRSFRCFGCGVHGDAVDYVMQTHSMTFAEAIEFLASEAGLISSDREYRTPNPKAPKTDRNCDLKAKDDAEVERKIAFAQKIWRESRLAIATPVKVYLRSRDIATDPPLTLRFHPALKHGRTGLFLPAMVAAVTIWPSREVTAIHRTFLVADGRKKAPVSQNKMMLGPCAGGAVRLAQAGEELVLAEGIETSLSILQATGKPTWACLSTSGLKSVILPPEVKTVIIAADGDKPGEKAAQEAARRFYTEGRTVKIARPPAGMDFNDLLQLPENVVLFPRGQEVANG